MRISIQIVAILLLGCWAFHAPAAEQRVLVIVLDGLRPDYVNEELTPNIHALAERGVFFEDNHAVYPTVTRVNSPSIATGSYPKTHGLMGNSVYFPAVEAGKGLSTSDARNLFRIDEATGGKLLTTISMGEHLENQGLKLLAVSAGSTGSGLLLNHKAAGLGLIQTDLVRPGSNQETVLQAVGPPPPEAMPNDARNTRIVDAYLHFGLGETPADVVFMWLSDPDKTAHNFGIGHPTSKEAIRLLDAQVGRILAELDARGLTDTINILITSDHGFSTHTGGANIWGRLKRDNLDRGVHVVGPAIYVTEGGQEQIGRIVNVLQDEPWVGSIFTEAREPGAVEGSYPGTFSFDAIHYAHERGPDILVGAAWTDEKNAFGFRGATTHPGTAGHGSPSPFDIRNTLVAAGPAFKSGIRTNVPSGNVDIAPTICRVLGIPIPESMDGRVLEEALNGGPEPRYVRTERRSHLLRAGSHEFMMRISTVAGHTYLDEAGRF